VLHLCTVLPKAGKRKNIVHVQFVVAKAIETNAACYGGDTAEIKAEEAVECVFGRKT
jgi:hypothetical protein